MENGCFTPEERAYLESLDAVFEVRARQIIYSKDFKINCMKRYHNGEKPSVIFAEAGLPSSLIGYKRIERAIYHWKEAEMKDALTTEEAPIIKRRNQVATIKRQKQKAVERQRFMRKRDEKYYKARIAKLEAEVEVLKAEGALAKQRGRAEKTLTKSEKFYLIAQIAAKRPQSQISAMCRALDVSRSGYYKWCNSSDVRDKKESADLIAKKQVEQAFLSHGFKKGSRQIKDSLLRDQGIVMNRKKIQRIMRKYDLIFSQRRKNPYYPIGSDGKPKVANNLLNRQFHQGIPRKVLLTDITYIPCTEGFSYLSVVIDGETDEVLAHVVSRSLEEKFILDTYDQLKHIQFAPGALSHSDRGCHYTARAFREKLDELGLLQSMSRKACCWDNASMESWFGRMKEVMGSTHNLSFEEVRKRVDSYIEYYNYHRGQKRLGWNTPKEYAAKLVA